MLPYFLGIQANVTIYLSRYIRYCRLSANEPMNNQCWRKDQFMADLQFNWIGFDQTRKYFVIWMYWNCSFQTGQTGDQPYIDTRANSEYSLRQLIIQPIAISYLLTNLPFALNSSLQQCDQMIRLFFNIGLFVAMELAQ